MKATIREDNRKSYESKRLVRFYFIREIKNEDIDTNISDIRNHCDDCICLSMKANRLRKYDSSNCL